MAKSIVENAEISFRMQFSNLKDITGMDNSELADLLGCSRSTVSKIYSDPLSVNGKYILLVQEYLKREERKRYD